MTHGHPCVNRVKRSSCSVAPAGRVAQSAAKFRRDLTRDETRRCISNLAAATGSTGGVYVRVINFDAAASKLANEPAALRQQQK